MRRRHSRTARCSIGNAARSSDASTENTCRSSRLIMIDADSSPTIVHRCEEEMPAAAPRSADTAGRGAALTVLGGVIEQLSLGCQPAAMSIHCRVFADCRRASSASCVTSASSKLGWNSASRARHSRNSPSAAMNVCSYPMMCPGRQKFPKIGMLHVGDEEIARPLFGRRLRRIQELQMIQPLEVESQHPARTVNLEEVLVLAADRKARRLERSRTAIRELHQRHHRIVDLDGSARWFARRRSLA